jgi:hypothetical protein
MGFMGLPAPVRPCPTPWFLAATGSGDPFLGPCGRREQTFHKEERGKRAGSAGAERTAGGINGPEALYDGVLTRAGTRLRG